MASKRPSDKPTAAERTALVTRLRDRRGIPAAWLTGVKPGMSWRQITERLIERLREGN